MFYSAVIYDAQLGTIPVVPFTYLPQFYSTLFSNNLAHTSFRLIYLKSCLVLDNFSFSEVSIQVIEHLVKLTRPIKAKESSQVYELEICDGDILGKI